MGFFTDFLKDVGGAILDEASKEMDRRKNSKNPEVQRQAEIISARGVDALNNGNFAEALKCFQTAYDMGHSGAMYNLGYMYENGEGVVRDTRKAFDWYLKAANYGDVEAMSMVADRYLLGNGVSENRSEAFKWHKKAAGYGNLNSMVSIAILYATDSQEDNSEAIAIDWMRKAIIEADRQNDAELFNVCVVRMRELGDIFLSQFEEMHRLAGEENIILSDLGDKDPSRNLYPAYLECYEIAAKCGDEIAQKTLKEIAGPSLEDVLDVALPLVNFII